MIEIGFLQRNIHTNNDFASFPSLECKLAPRKQRPPTQKKKNLWAF